jgi:hypothetical protein
MTKYILIGLVVVGAILIVATTRPDTFRVQRTATIDAPPETILPLIDSVKANAQWSPYFRKDPAMKSVYSGPERGPGARVEFDGNKEVGSGRLTVTDESTPEKVVMRLEMLEPFAADNRVEFTLVPKGAATDVTWSMEGPVPFLAKIIHLVFDMDRMVGTDFAAGLHNLKVIAEH